MTIGRRDQTKLLVKKNRKGRVLTQFPKWQKSILSPKSGVLGNFLSSFESFIFNHLNSKNKKLSIKKSQKLEINKLYRMREYFSFLVKEIDVLINLRHSHSADMAEMNEYFTDVSPHHLVSTPPLFLSPFHQWNPRNRH